MECSMERKGLWEEVKELGAVKRRLLWVGTVGVSDRGSGDLDWGS